VATRSAPHLVQATAFVQRVVEGTMVAGGVTTRTQRASIPVMPSPDISRGRGETARDPMSHNDDRGIRRHDEVFRRPFHRYRVGRWSFGRLAWSSLGP
jgi:hypothetical protein